jgi:nucleoside-diphosphate-sugar epimerase
MRLGAGRADEPAARRAPTSVGNAPGGRRALVTGCAGFIGSHLSERLIADGFEVVGVDCFTRYYARAIKEGNIARLREDPRFSLREVDLSRAPLVELLEGVDVVYHLAAQPGVRDSFGAGFQRYLRNNVLATQRLLEAACNAGVGRFVYASSSSVYGDAERFPTAEDSVRMPRSPYGLTKVATEELVETYCRQSEMRAAGLRYFTVYGPRQRPDMAFTRFALAALEGRPITVLGDGSQIRDFTFVEDAVDATLAAARAERKVGVYNIGGGTQARLIDAIRIIEDLVGSPVTIDYRPTARGDVWRTCADTRRAERELGFRPRTSLREGLGRQVSWVQGHVRGLEEVAA